MLGPVVPYSLRGAIWYQGESNASRPEQYRVLLPMMIRDWRERWGQGDFAFGIVQLANFMAASDEPSDPDWAHLRDAQLHAARTVSNAGLAVATDIGEANDIHPRNKQDVGRRLARWALADVYGLDILPSGPLFQDYTVNGERVLCRFAHVGDGLKVMHGGAPDGFFVAGQDQVWHWADAELVGKDVVAVWSEAVPEPVAVRYAWANNPVRANLVNSAQLPAVAFRSDDWPRGD
jgi:sialate O-acetylesterase